MYIGQTAIAYAAPRLFVLDVCEDTVHIREEGEREMSPARPKKRGKRKGNDLESHRNEKKNKRKKKKNRGLLPPFGKRDREIGRSGEREREMRCIHVSLIAIHVIYRLCLRFPPISFAGFPLPPLDAFLDDFS